MIWLVRLDDYASEAYTTRSGAITMMVGNYLNSRQVVSSLQQITSALQSVADGKQLTEAEQQQLDSFVALSRILPK